MLGDFGAYGTMYRGDSAALVAREGEDLGKALEKAIRSLPADIMDAPGAAPVVETVTPALDAETTPVGSMFVGEDGSVMLRKPDSVGQHQAEKVEFPNEKAADRVAGMVRVRDAFARLRRAQIDEGATDAKIESLRKRLNSSTTASSEKHGPINADANQRLFLDDPAWPQIAALEEKFDKGLCRAVAKKTGETPRAPFGSKAPIFFKRTQSPYRRPTAAPVRAKDALAQVLARSRPRRPRGHVAALRQDAARDRRRARRPSSTARPDDTYETADDYLSGNVKRQSSPWRSEAAEDRSAVSTATSPPFAMPSSRPTSSPWTSMCSPAPPGYLSYHIAAFIDHIVESKGAHGVLLSGQCHVDRRPFATSASGAERMVHRAHHPSSTSSRPRCNGADSQDFRSQPRWQQRV